MVFSFFEKTIENLEICGSDHFSDPPLDDNKLKSITKGLAKI